MCITKDVAVYNVYCVFNFNPYDVDILSSVWYNCSHRKLDLTMNTLQYAYHIATLCFIQSYSFHLHNTIACNLYDIFLDLLQDYQLI